MAAKLRTSHSQLDRLLDPQNTSASLETLSRAAKALGKRLVLRIEDREAPAETARHAKPEKGRGRLSPY